jgi:hypothetical protein
MSKSKLTGQRGWLRHNLVIVADRAKQAIKDLDEGEIGGNMLELQQTFRYAMKNLRAIENEPG